MSGSGQRGRPTSSDAQAELGLFAPESKEAYQARLARARALLDAAEEKHERETREEKRARIAGQARKRMEETKAYLRRQDEIARRARASWEGKGGR